jgi:endonuclease/exonuclease/phosphatase (EEP) superfamily protein YafD
MISTHPGFWSTRSLRLTAALLLGSYLAIGVGTAFSATLDTTSIASRPEVLRAAPGVWSSDIDSDVSISGSEIRLLVWNVHKGASDDWAGDFRTMSSDSDLVLLQEAHLREAFTSGLVDMPRWDMVDAWDYVGLPTGVLTASNAAPLEVRALEQREPWLRTNKSSLLTEYRLAHTDLTLLVANVHAINFTADTRAFRQQLIAVAELVSEHDGPVIFSGDLNTWRAGRREIVDAIARSLGLREVLFDGPRKQFGRFPLDHVFYRDLDLLTAAVPAVNSSDHNPLMVSFRNPGYLRGATLGLSSATESMP